MEPYQKGGRSMGRGNGDRGKKEERERERESGNYDRKQIRRKL